MDETGLVDMVLASGRMLRGMRNHEQPLHELRPDPAADAAARQALTAEADAEFLLRHGVSDGWRMLLRASALDNAAQILRRTGNVED